MKSAKISLFAFPLHLSSPNAYWDGLAQALGEIRPFRMINGSWGLLLMSWGGRNVIHIHWPLILYASRYSWLQPIKYLVTSSIIRLAKLRGDRLVWTMHNAHDHDQNHDSWDERARIFLARQADAIIVHTQAGVEVAQRLYGRTSGVYTIPHGHTVDFYGPMKVEPDAALTQQFALEPSDKVFLHLGSIRPYKGLERLITVFGELPEGYKLLIAGKSFNQAYAAKLQQLATSSSVIIHTGRVADSDMPSYYSLARGAIFAFSEILTSGSVIVALSYGLPVIVPDKGDMPYLITHDNGYLYQTDEELKRHIISLGTLDTVQYQHLSQQAQQSVLKNSYQSIAQLTLQAYGIQ